MNRLKGVQNVSEVFKKGKTIDASGLRFFYLSSAKSAWGVSVGKRNFSLAVERNKIKRMLREGVRKQLVDVVEGLGVSCHFVVLYVGKKAPQKKVLDGMFDQLVKKIIKHSFL
jgi:ribonuclease P protein component